MKYLIFSDVHGSSYYMSKIIHYFKKFHCDKLICLGDLLYHGPRNNLPYGHNPKEVVKLINEYKDRILMVKGNCEAEVDQMVLDFPIYETANLFDKRNIVLTHGHHINPTNPIPVLEGSIVFYGHTHISKVDLVEGVYYINPGSISLPKDNTKHRFIVLEDDLCEWYDSDGIKSDELILI